MKILSLRFKNLNSLYGEWSIDFQNPEYTSEGIFVLSGPTGSGKTTVLDAICLGLYGQTPRLKKISKSDNEIMSRHTAESFSEIIFEFKLKRYCCYWSQSRARKKINGNLVDYTHEISDADTKELIESKKSEVPKYVADLIGMDFKQFTKAVLLAQGDFDEFLDSKEKSEILEKITGTEIYSQISQKVYERWYSEKSLRDKLNNEWKAICCLTEEEETALRDEIQKVVDELNQLKSQWDLVKKGIEWLDGIEKLNQEITDRENSEKKVKEDIDAFAPDKKRLDRAKDAMNLEGDYSNLISLQRQNNDSQKELKDVNDSLPALQVVFENAKKQLDSLQKNLNKAEEARDSNLPLIREIIQRDSTLREKKISLDRDQSEIGRLGLDIEKLKKEQAKRNESKQQLAKRLEQLESSLQTHADDEQLVSEFSGIESDLQYLLRILDSINDEKENLPKINDSIKDQTARVEESRKATEKLKETGKITAEELQQLEKEQTLLLNGQTEEDYSGKINQLRDEKSRREAFASMEEQRHLLTDGSPCPLCGALTHPFAEGNVPSPDEIVLQIQKIDQLLKDVKKQTKQIDKCNKQLVENQYQQEISRNTESQEKDRLQQEEARLAEMTAKLQKSQQEYEERKQSLLKKLQPFAISCDFTRTTIPALIESLQNRLKEWKKNNAEKSQCQKEQEETDREIEKLDVNLAEKNKSLDEKQKMVSALLEEYQTLNKERQDLFGDKVPEEEEKRFNDAVENAKKSLQEGQQAFEQSKTALANAKTQQQTLVSQIEQLSPILLEQDTKFKKLLAEANFSDLDDFKSSRLDKPERDKLQERSDNLNQQLSTLSTLLADCHKRLADERNQELTPKSKEELTEELKNLQVRIEELDQERIEKSAQINQDLANRKQAAEKETAARAQEAVYQQWETLNKLIGSSDGKRFREYAQGLTFDNVIALANQQMTKMSDRYSLVRSTKTHLDLDVIDRYQGNEKRPASNLSGGERFLVSLALALGLSGMASGKFGVDSLFLDEGFGTLDENTLETVIQALVSIQQTGKLIGIISHRPELKERIRTQIIVTPISNGKSELSGPGICRK